MRQHCPPAHDRPLRGWVRLDAPNPSPAGAARPTAAGRRRAARPGPPAAPSRRALPPRRPSGTAAAGRVPGQAQHRVGQFRQPGEPVGAVLDPAHGGLAAGLVAVERLPEGLAAGQLGGQHGRVHHGAVGALPQVRRHGVGGVAEQHQPTVRPAAAVDPNDVVEEQLVEPADAGQHRRRRRQRRAPQLAERHQVPRGERGGHAAEAAAHDHHVGALDGHGAPRPVGCPCAPSLAPRAPGSHP